MQPPVVSLMPGAEAVVAIRLHPIRKFDTASGRHDFFVSTVSTVSAEAAATASGSFEVADVRGDRRRAHTAAVRDGAPSEAPGHRRQSGQRSGVADTRRERSQRSARVSAPRRGVRCRTWRGAGSSISVCGPAGCIGSASPLRIRSRSQPRPPPNDEHSPAGTLVQKAVLPIWLLALAGVAAVALVAVIALGSRKDQNFNAQPSGQVSPTGASPGDESGAPSDSSSAPSVSSDAGGALGGAVAGPGGGGGGGGGGNPSAQAQSGADRYAKAVLADHPVAFYRFGQDAAADSSGNNNIGNFDGGAQRSPTALLDGNDGSANFPAPSGGAKPSFCVSRPGELLTDIPFSAEAWIKTTDRDGPIFSLRSMHFASGFDFGVGYSPWSADGQNGHDNNGSLYVWERGTTPNEASPQQGGDSNGVLQFPGVNESPVSANVVDGEIPSRGRGSRHGSLRQDLCGRQAGLRGPEGQLRQPRARRPGLHRHGARVRSSAELRTEPPCRCRVPDRRHRVRGAVQLRARHRTR